MMESDLLKQTRLLVRQDRLPTDIGLGEEWVIILAMSSREPGLATGLYESTLTDLKCLYPHDVHETFRSTRRRSTSYLLVRTGSLAMTYLLTLPARFRSDSVYLGTR
jgi:hypothetical protein